MRRSLLSTVFLLAFLATVFGLQWWERSTYPPWLWMTLTACGGVSVVMGCVVRPAFLVTLAIVGVSIGFGVVARGTHVDSERSVERFATGRTLIVHGFVADEPDRRENVTFYDVRADAVLVDNEWRSVTGMLLVRDAKGWPQATYGQEITALGTMEPPKPINGFRYDRYLGLRGIHAILRTSELLPGERNDGNALLASLYRLKGAWERRIDRLLPEPQSALLAGLLTGTRRGIPEDLTDAFNATGLTHIVAISGTNITIIVSLLGSALFWVPRRWRVVPTAAAIACFTLLVGASASVVRAAIMGSLALLATGIERKTDGRLLVLWTLFAMLCWRPAQLWDDAGFQLSYLALVGLMEVSPLLDPLFARIPWPTLRETLQMTLSAQIATTPWIAHLFGRISLIAPVSNLLVVPLVPLAMALGAASVALSWLWFPAGLLVAYGTWGILELAIRIVWLLAALPYASVTVSELSTPVTAVAYVLLILVIVFLRRRSPSVQPHLLPRPAGNLPLGDGLTVVEPEDRRDHPRPGPQLAV